MRSGKYAALLLSLSHCVSSLSATEHGRIASVHTSAAATTVTAVLDPNLDLATRIALERAEVVSPVPLGPRMVVGQGADPGNLSFVRVLNESGLATAQFLAYPTSVKGGVHVVAGRDISGEAFILAAPISDRSIQNLRVFDAHGGFRAELVMPRSLVGPFVVAAGDFLASQPGSEIAITLANQRAGAASGVVLYTPDGVYLDAIRFTAPASGAVRLEAAETDSGVALELFYLESGHLLKFDTLGGQHEFKQLSFDAPVDGLYRSAFGEQTYLATLVSSDLSEALLVHGNEVGARQNLGRHENEFWITAGNLGLTEEQSGDYIKFARYGHIRTDGSSPAYRDASIFTSEVAEDWEAGLRPAAVGLGQLNQSLDKQQRVLWEPCFTHRQFNSRFDSWEEIVDESTGLPKYLALSRLNEISYYGEFGKTNSFVGSSYAPGLSALDRLYLLPLRAFLFKLSQSFRQHPERVISVEPNHEFEIAVKENKSVGDYNPAMIRGFREYLRNLYGEDLEKVLAARKGPSVQEFDAPRDTQRGAWDAYDTNNAFFNDWVFYNRYVVNRRLSDTFTQALLAGLPAEILRTHQIPDRYAIGTLDLFSERMVRITPIDYALTSGVGFGFTRFTVWFNKPNYAFKAGFSSGFDSITFGEYQALTSDQDLANEQLIHVWEKGANAIHAMKWPDSHDRGFNKTMRGAIENLVENYDRPRTAVTGGISQIKPYIHEDRRFNIAAIGQGANKRGLLKSLREDGTWEGSVYTVPFRTAITVQALKVESRISEKGLRVLEVGPLKGLESGEQVVIHFIAKSSTSSALRFDLRHQTGGPLPGYGQVVAVGAEPRDYRFVLRTQLPADGLVLCIELPDGVVVEDATAQRETEEVARPHRDDHEGVPHQGGVAFDLLP
jgi:hypothetical protein